MFLSITSVTPEGKVAKYQPFENEADAEEHATQFGGFVITTPEGSMDFWVVDPVAKTVVIDTVAQIDTAYKIKANNERIWRDAELVKTDFTQLSDSPVDEIAYATYRQELRDIPTLMGFPNTHTRPKLA